MANLNGDDLHAVFAMCGIPDHQGTARAPPSLLMVKDLLSWKTSVSSKRTEILQRWPQGWLVSRTQAEGRILLGTGCFLNRMLLGTTVIKWLQTRID
jgi:hypothetical protein